MFFCINYNILIEMVKNVLPHPLSNAQSYDASPTLCFENLLQCWVLRINHVKDQAKQEGYNS